MISVNDEVELRPVRFDVNGKTVKVAVEPRLHLADFLRDHLRLTGTHVGCEHGVCGACTVLVEGHPIRSCITFAAACDGKRIRTIEDFSDDEDMIGLREAFSREHGLQCGFCTPGMLITARDIVRRLPLADEARIRIELSGNICRCTGYVGIVSAVAGQIRGRQTVQSSDAVVGEVSKAAIDAFVGFEADDIAGPQVDVAKKSISPPLQSRPGWSSFAESFTIAMPAQRVWDAFADVPLVASCMTGVELGEYSTTHAQGRMSINVGPIRASFAGAASIERDDSTMTGKIVGAGSDQKSSTKTRGEVTYTVISQTGQSALVSVVSEYNLQGPLAQFSRSSLVQEVGRRMVADFAANLNARLSGTSNAGKSNASSLSAFWLLRISLAHIVRRIADVVRRRV